MTDIFHNKILCGNCDVKMIPQNLEKNNFILRYVICPRCNNKIIHPEDEVDFKEFSRLKNKQFRVKMRIVGNSYAISIPKEIVNFIKDQENIRDNMVRLNFNDSRRLSLVFGEDN